MVRIYKNFPKRLYPYNLFNHFLRGQVWMVVWMCGCWMDVGDGNDGMDGVGMVLHVT